MCGICGYIDQKQHDKNIIHHMNNKLVHRGPDSEGYFITNNCSMAMRRLKIIDLNTGDQPIYSNKTSN